ncbi:MAG: uroporphyrinogen decarboxylase family protein [Acidobacteriota bacterium]
MISKLAGPSRRERLLTAFRGGCPDRVPFSPSIMRWIRYHYGCTCPLHQLKLAEDLDLDLLICYGLYVWRTVRNDYVYTPAGGHAYAASGLGGDLPGVTLELKVENRPDEVWFRRTFKTPEGQLGDVLRWARPDRGYGDGPNPVRVEPLVKSRDDLPALRHLFPPARRDVVADLPLLLDQVGERALVAAYDNTHPGGWGLEALGEEGRLIASVEDPDLVLAVARYCQDVHLENLRLMLEQGVKAVFDSWSLAGLSMGWSPNFYRRVFLQFVSETARLVHDYRAIYIYHDDGRMRDLIPLLLDAQVDVISGLQPPEVGDVGLREAKELAGGRAALFGGLDPCYTFDLGSAEKVTAAVKKAIEEAASGGGYVVGTAEGISPSTPLESLRAGVAAVKRYGRYQCDQRSAPGGPLAQEGHDR